MPIVWNLKKWLAVERDIYRPGERVNFSVILRDRQWQSPSELPLVLKFLLPNGKELKTFRKTTNAQGSIEGNVDILRLDGDRLSKVSSFALQGHPASMRGSTP